MVTLRWRRRFLFLKYISKATSSFLCSSKAPGSPTSLLGNLIAPWSTSEMPVCWQSRCTWGGVSTEYHGWKAAFDVWLAEAHAQNGSSRSVHPRQQIAKQTIQNFCGRVMAVLICTPAYARSVKKKQIYFQQKKQETTRKGGVLVLAHLRWHFSHRCLINGVSQYAKPPSWCRSMIFLPELSLAAALGFWVWW